MVGGGRRFLFIAPFSIAHLLGREGGILISFLRLSLVLSLACSLFPVFAWLVSFPSIGASRYRASCRAYRRRVAAA